MDNIQASSKSFTEDLSFQTLFFYHEDVITINGFHPKVNLNSNKHVSELQNDIKGVSRELEEVFKHNITERGSLNGFLIIEQRLHEIAMPSNELLIIKAKFYKEKYGINIFIAENEQLINLINENCNQYPSEPVGLIFCHEETHVVPIILNFSALGKEIIILDVLGPLPQNKVSEMFLKLLKSTNVPFGSCSYKRQVDKFSCRTGSLVTLRNALLDLKSNLLEKSLFEYVSCKSDLFSIPPAWGFTDQIFKCEEAMFSVMNPRQPYSKLIPKKIVDNISESRGKYQKKLIFDCSLKLPYPNLKTLKTIQKVIAKRDFPFMIEFTTQSSSSNQYLIIEWTSQTIVNTYMLSKGFKICESGDIVR